MRTLWVAASPNRDLSLSSALALEFLSAAPVSVIGEIEQFNVWTDKFPDFGRDAAAAKFALLFGEEISEHQKEPWQGVLSEIERVRRFDRVVVSSPMWNWNIPHRLKAWIDVIVQPAVSFTLDGDGKHVGTLGQGKPLQLVLTRSSAYDGRSPELQDFQQPYLEYVFTMLGYSVDTFVVEPTTRWTAEARQRFRQKSLASIREYGISLGHGI